jgi:hypothetical protein
MELEQLVGSHSFGNAMKQPFVLRRLDLLTLGLFLVWCLSPLGSQGLQRSFKIVPHVTTDTSDVWFLNTTGTHPLFSSSLPDKDVDLDRARKLQLMSVYYNSAFLPLSERDLQTSVDQDPYDNPAISLLNPPRVSSPYQSWPSVSAYGVPFSLPEAKFINDTNLRPSKRITDVTDYDKISFNMNSSYFDFTCENWSLVELGILIDSLNFSNNYEFGIGMSDRSHNSSSPDYRPNYLALASKNRETAVSKPHNGTSYDIDPVAEYSFIECTFQRVFVDVPVTCWRDAEDGTLPYCENRPAKPAKVQPPQDPQDRIFKDFSFDWIYETNAASEFGLTTPSKYPLVISVAVSTWHPTSKY